MPERIKIISLKIEALISDTMGEVKFYKDGKLLAKRMEPYPEGATLETVNAFIDSMTSNIVKAIMEH